MQHFRGDARRAAGKRERLVAAARRVLYEHGVEKATLADIAAAADVPLGNVYYYFKTKDALVAAVIKSYRRSYHEHGAELDQQEGPAGRLKALVRALTAGRDQLASYGCPVGSLSSELDKREDALRAEAGTILAGLIEPFPSWLCFAELQCVGGLGDLAGAPGGWKVPAHPKLDLAAAGESWRPAALTLTLGEPAHSSCRVGSARRRGSQRERNQHRRVRTTVPPFAEGTAPLRRTRGTGARARRPGKRLSLLRHSPARPGAPCRDDAPVAVAA